MTVCIMCHCPFDPDGLHKCPNTGEVICLASSPEMGIEEKEIDMQEAELVSKERNYAGG